MKNSFLWIFCFDKMNTHVSGIIACRISFDRELNLLDSVVDQLLRYLSAKLAVRRLNEHENFRINP